MKKIVASSAIALVCLVIVGCSDPAPPVVEPQQDMRTISGTVKIRERIGLTPDSRLEIKLLDVSVADAPAVEIVAEAIENPGQSPIEFAIQYDATLIDTTHRYSIAAKIFDRGRLILLSDTNVPVLTHNAAENPRIVVVRVSQSSAAQPDADATD
jgi:putative lipoprotein